MNVWPLLMLPYVVLNADLSITRWTGGYRTDEDACLCLVVYFDTSASANSTFILLSEDLLFDITDCDYVNKTVPRTGLCYLPLANIILHSKYNIRISETFVNKSIIESPAKIIQMDLTVIFGPMEILNVAVVPSTADIRLFWHQNWKSQCFTGMQFTIQYLEVEVCKYGDNVTNECLPSHEISDNEYTCTADSYRFDKCHFDIQPNIKTNFTYSFRMRYATFFVIWSNWSQPVFLPTIQNNFVTPVWQDCSLFSEGVVNLKWKRSESSVFDKIIKQEIQVQQNKLVVEKLVIKGDANFYEYRGNIKSKTEFYIQACTERRCTMQSSSCTVSPKLTNSIDLLILLPIVLSLFTLIIAIVAFAYHRSRWKKKRVERSPQSDISHRDPYKISHYAEIRFDNSIPSYNL